MWKCVDLCLAGEWGDGVCVSIRGKRYVPLLTTQWRPSRRPSADTLQDSASWQTSPSVSSTLSSSSCLHQTSYTSKRMSGNSSNVSSALSNQTVVFSPLAQPQMASVFATPVCLTFVSYSFKSSLTTPQQTWISVVSSILESVLTPQISSPCSETSWSAVSIHTHHNPLLLKPSLLIQIYNRNQVPRKNTPSRTHTHRQTLPRPFPWPPLRHSMRHWFREQTRHRKHASPLLLC